MVLEIVHDRIRLIKFSITPREALEILGTYRSQTSTERVYDPPRSDVFEEMLKAIVNLREQGKLG